MAVTHINVKKTEGVLWEFELEVGSNTVSCAGEYTDDYKDWLKRCPEANSAHPDFPALKLKKIKGKRQPGDLITVSLTYESNNPDADYPGREKGKIKRYSIRPNAGEEPFLTFHKLDDLEDASREAIGELLASSRTKEDFEKAIGTVGLSGPDSTLATLAIGKIRKGIEAYKHAGIVWVERFTSSDINDLECDKFYTIDTAVPGNPPTLSDGANWLRIPGTAEPNEDGETWEIERMWEASLRGGWDDWFYGSAGGEGA